MVSEIVAAAERGAELTHQLLAFGRQQVITPKDLDFNRIVANFEPILRRLLVENIALRVRLGSRPLVVVADQNQLEQVLLNLLVNARDAIQEAGAIDVALEPIAADELYAASHPELIPGAYVLLSVRDTGVGMTQDVLDEIFEPFFTTKPPGQGTGLGLSTVYGIVQQAGGYVGVDSQPGLGSTFRVYLPEVTEAPESARGVPAPVVTAGRETVLVCEDDAAVRVLSVRILREAGYQVIAAQNAEEALVLGAAHDGPIHLLVADVMLPGKSGRSLAEELTRGQSELRVLFVSGYAAPAVPGDARLDPTGDLLEKPYTRDALLRRVRSILDRVRKAGK
jgi:CheY-like chemotaxis protein